MAIDLFTLIFEQLLKIDPSIISKYATISDQLIYLLLIPNIILILFLYGFGRILAPEHKGLRYLVSVGAYIVIVFTGWYGTLAQLSVMWFYIMLIFGFFLFFISKIYHPITARKLGKDYAPKIGEKAFRFLGKGKELEKLNAERKYYQKQITDIRRSPPNQMNAVLQRQYEDRLHEIETQIKKLGG